MDCAKRLFRFKHPFLLNKTVRVCRQFPADGSSGGRFAVHVMSSRDFVYEIVRLQGEFQHSLLMFLSQEL